MKVAIYCRVSTNDQDISMQRDLLVKWCNSNNHTFRTFQDEAISGSIIDRPDWVRMLQRCQNKEFDCILVQKYDRISRDLKYALEFLDWLYQNPHIRLISLYDGEFSFEPNRIFMFKLQFLLSEYELETARWRRNFGVEKAKREGKYKGGKKGRTWKKS